MTGTFKVNIKDIRVGNIVFHDGEARTVTGKDLKHCKLFGPSIFGDSYKAGHEPVLLIPHFGKFSK